MSKVDVLGLDNVLLDVGDLEAARGFYGGRLGLGVKFDFPEAGIVGFRVGDEEPGLLVRAGDVPPGPPRPSPRLWLEVPDAQAAGAALAAAGVAPAPRLPAGRPHWGQDPCRRTRRHPVRRLASPCQGDQDPARPVAHRPHGPGR